MSIGLTAPAVSSRAASRGACSPFANRDQYPEPSPFARLVAPRGADVTIPSRRRSGRPDDENARVPPRMSAERDVFVTGDDAGASSPRSSRVRRARPGRPPRAEGVGEIPTSRFAVEKKTREPSLAPRASRVSPTSCADHRDVPPPFYPFLRHPRLHARPRRGSQS